MPRRLITFILSLVLTCSGFNAVARVMAPALGDGHALSHLMSESHHHHDDGSIDADDSEESARHMQCDDGLNNPGLLVPTWLSATSPGPSAAPAERQQRTMPTPFLEGPMRPPRG